MAQAPRAKSYESGILLLRNSVTNIRVTVTHIIREDMEPVTHTYTLHERIRKTSKGYVLETFTFSIQDDGPTPTKCTKGNHILECRKKKGEKGAYIIASKVYSRLAKRSTKHGLCESWNLPVCKALKTALESANATHNIGGGPHTLRPVQHLQDTFDRFVAWYQRYSIPVPIELGATPDPNAGTPKRLAIAEKEDIYPKIIDDARELYDGGNMNAKTVFERLSELSKDKYGISFSSGSLRGIFQRKGGKFKD